jgi:hypothetical protein
MKFAEAAQECIAHLFLRLHDDDVHAAVPHRTPDDATCHTAARGALQPRCSEPRRQGSLLGTLRLTLTKDELCVVCCARAKKRCATDQEQRRVADQDESIRMKVIRRYGREWVRGTGAKDEGATATSRTHAYYEMNDFRAPAARSTARLSCCTPSSGTNAAAMFVRNVERRAMRRVAWQ